MYIIQYMMHSNNKSLKHVIVWRNSMYSTMINIKYSSVTKFLCSNLFIIFQFLISVLDDYQTTHFHIQYLIFFSNSITQWTIQFIVSCHYVSVSLSVTQTFFIACIFIVFLHFFSLPRSIFLVKWSHVSVWKVSACVCSRSLRRMRVCTRWL